MIKSASCRATAGFLVWHEQFKTSALAEEERTGANRANGEGKEILCSLCSLLFKSGPGGVVELDFDKSISDGVNIYAQRDGDADFVFLARDTCLRREGRGYGRQAASPYIDNRLPALDSLGDGRREYNADRVQS